MVVRSPSEPVATPSRIPNVPMLMMISRWVLLARSWRNAECDTLDSKTGEILDPGLVAVARSEEMRYMDDIGHV